MSASLVGSEMCIRDSQNGTQGEGATQCVASRRSSARTSEQKSERPEFAFPSNPPQSANRLRSGGRRRAADQGGARDVARGAPGDERQDVDPESRA
eukprot:9245234-Alexandrium_andersonii.AAC.1